jgi:hypothetical protein
MSTHRRVRSSRPTEAPLLSGDAHGSRHSTRPDLIAAAADADPRGIATYSWPAGHAGARCSGAAGRLRFHDMGQFCVSA